MAEKPELFWDRKVHILIIGSGVWRLSRAWLVRCSGGGDGMSSTSGLKLTLLVMFWERVWMNNEEMVI
ncbi:hypothetical protein Hanom_Chr15g01338701 [Helianthus anomalus]